MLLLVNGSERIDITASIYIVTNFISLPILQNKHITLISLNFYPEDTAIGLYSTQLAEHLSSQGVHLSVITGFPYYPKWEIAQDYKEKGSYYKEQKGPITIYRYKQFTPKKPTFLTRVAHIVDFTIGSRSNLNHIKACDIVISVIPFTSSAWLGNTLSRKRNAKHWIHIQDFEFDAAFQSGIATHSTIKNVLHKGLMRLEQNILNKADRVSTISHAMIAKLNQKTDCPKYYLPNWIDAQESDPSQITPHDYFAVNLFSILYAGNVGDKQDWAFFEEVVSKLNFGLFEVIVVGAGAKMDLLKERLKHTPVKFYAPIAIQDLSSLLASADVHILFQKTSVIDTVMPSKILGMMASAKPSIIMGNTIAEPSAIINSSRGGYYNAVADSAIVLRQLEELRTNSDYAAALGQQAREYVIENYARTAILTAFTAELDRL